MEIDPPIRTARPSATREFYLAYLNSADWRSKRNKAIRKARFRCQRCGEKRDLQAHHLTYDRLGHELASDIEVVCRTCHESEHIEQMSESDQVGVYLKLASEALRARPYDSIGELSETVKVRCAKLKISYDDHQIEKALALLSGTRIGKGQTAKTVQPATSAPEGHDPTPSEAHEIIKRIGMGAMKDAIVKTMPEARLFTEREVGKIRAAEMVSKEILESIRRCEELERALPQTPGEPA